MAHSLWSDRPLGATLGALAGAGARSTGRTAENIDAQAATDEVARMATPFHSSVARFRY